MDQAFSKVLDDNPSVTAVVEEDFENYGRVNYGSDLSRLNAVGELASHLAASTAGISLRLDSAEASDIGRHVMQASVDGRGSRHITGLRNSSERGVIDPTILALMNVSEFYTLTEGDLWQFGLVPLQLGFHQDIRLTGDDGAIREARDYLDELRISDRIEELWLARWVYGNAYAAFERENPSNLSSPVSKIYALNSKHVAIRPQLGVGERSMAYAPPADTIKAISAMGDVPSFIVRPISSDWNEPTQRRVAVAYELRDSDVYHFHTPKLPNHIYAVPPLSRAMTAIDARRDLDVMSRATIKGYRSQLWVFLLDKAKKGEAKALREALGSDAKTGVIVWGSNLKVEQHAPKSLDDLLGNDAQWAFTMRVYRDIGITPRLVAGESPTLRAASGDSETDVSVFLDKLLYDRDPFQRFIRMVLRSRFGDKAPVATLPDIQIAIANRIKNILVPLLNFGVPSPTTAFQMAGLDPLAERQLHEGDWAWREKYMHPYTGFSQAGPSGVTNSPQGGRPAGTTEMNDRATKEKAEASTLSDYQDEISAQWAMLAERTANPESGEDERRVNVAAFIMALRTAAAIYRRRAYLDGYASVGGYAGVDPERVEMAVAWDELNLLDLEAEMLRRVSVGEDISGLRYRASLYATSGYSYAFAAGVWQAQIERGMTHWIRVLNPMGSRSGPCHACVADAGRLHPITEPWSDHPNGVCRQRFFQFYTINNAGRFPGGVIRVPYASSPAVVSVEE